MSRYWQLAVHFWKADNALCYAIYCRHPACAKAAWTAVAQAGALSLDEAPLTSPHSSSDEEEDEEEDEQANNGHNKAVSERQGSNSLRKAERERKQQQDGASSPTSVRSLGAIPGMERTSAGISSGGNGKSGE